MEVSDTAAPALAASEPSLSLMSRTVAIFTNPGAAWQGLKTRSQWWFPMLLLTVLSVGMTAALHERAVVPMIVAGWEQMVDDGRMTADQVERMAEGMRGPGGMLMTAGPQLVAWPVILLLLAAGISFGVSFILGSKLGFRHSLEIISWSTLVLIPSYLLFGVLAWTKESMQGIHLGLGLLVPQSEPPERWQTGLASFLDAAGPFEIWCLAVVVIGVSAFTGVQRKPAAWVLGGLFLALRAAMAAMGALFSPGA